MDLRGRGVGVGRVRGCFFHPGLGLFWGRGLEEPVTKLEMCFLSLGRKSTGLSEGGRHQGRRTTWDVSLAEKRGVDTANHPKQGDLSCELGEVGWSFEEESSYWVGRCGSWEWQKGWDLSILRKGRPPGSPGHPWKDMFELNTLPRISLTRTTVELCHGLCLLSNSLPLGSTWENS